MHALDVRVHVRIYYCKQEEILQNCSFFVHGELENWVIKKYFHTNVVLIMGFHTVMFKTVVVQCIQC